MMSWGASRSTGPKSHSLRDDDLAYLMGFGNNTKELHKLAGKLREGRFLNVYAPSGLPLRSLS